jgi:5-(carboxyamino)imidazole ribonucleotide mutase
MESALPILKEAGVSAHVEVSSAHRQPDRTAELARTAEAEGYGVVICGGRALRRPAREWWRRTRSLPVIGLPLNAALGGLDALLSVAQMPRRGPVAAPAASRPAEAPRPLRPAAPLR